MPHRYDGRVALVTGAASGIGRATAARLRDEGARVAGLDVATVDLDGVHGIRCDLRDEDQVDAAVAEAAEWGGRIDLLANVAGVASSAHTTDVTLAEWDRILAVNLTGTFLACRAALPHLIAAQGAVVNVASLAGVRGWRYSAAYSAAKGGVVALTRALAVEYAPDGVRVACVCPGSVDTPLKRDLVPAPDQDPRLAGHARALLDPPVADPAEVAAAIAYLGSAEARFATGAVLRLDGGAGV
ncbi:SDR family oxidoreductase [Dactylosporangium sp. NBC_01737]|uniref:SDR family NAD(P)-dependent oxidoreductase n=1 Tax=Dactylosporangium sp. NBC_01737 TaxID=2975959 RepID=UPI002E149F0A|nr:SDR family oxidoreductase [Dactylosporangium sp. NBC_01737]